jgi:hypothetical protein
MDVCPYAGNVTDKKAGREPPEHIVAQNRLQMAVLIRCFDEGKGGYFILEDVATRKRQRFEGIEPLLAELEGQLRS